jgi:DNA-directed RNA polymerase sigma subunit (sigma70/sigma32)
MTKAPTSYDPNNPRTAEILARRSIGETYKTIGLAVGLSVERIRQIITITTRRIEGEHDREGRS